MINRFKKAKQCNVGVIPYEQCIAKSIQGGSPGISVLEHCFLVGCIAEKLIKFYPKHVQDILGKYVHIISACHDIGKISPGFQKKILNQHLENISLELFKLDNALFEKDHSIISGISINNLLNSGSTEHPIAQIAAMHHGTLRSVIIKNENCEIYGGEEWAKERRKLFDALCKKFNTALPNDSISIWHRNLLAGLTTIADWIASDEDYFNQKGIQEGSNINSLVDTALKSCKFSIPKIRPGLSFRDIFGKKPYQVQKDFYERVSSSGIYILEAPMGSGKTEAALYASYKLLQADHNRGIYFALPTRLTSDRIYKRFDSFLNEICKNSMIPRVVHSTAWINPPWKGNELAAGRSWFDQRKRILLFPFSVGTIDQALLSILNVQHFFVRIFALAGKVIILDEVHSYDSYTGLLISDLSKILVQIGCTVIVLSATLTAEKRSTFFSNKSTYEPVRKYPLVSYQVSGSETVELTSDWQNSQKYELCMISPSDNCITDRALEEARKGQCVLLIANTVERAQNWYDEFASKILENEMPIGLLHSRMPQFLRNCKENYWIPLLGKNSQRPDKCILVSTQVAEQSVDIDADCLFSEIAPMDMLLQRMGRQWRHKRDDRKTKFPVCYIIVGKIDNYSSDNFSIDDIHKAFGKSNCLVYHTYVLYRTYRKIIYLKSISLPSNIPDLLESTYREVCEQVEVLKNLKTDLKEKQQRLESLAKAAESDVSGMPAVSDDISTRYGEYPRADMLLVRRISIVAKGKECELELIDGNSVRVSERCKDLNVSAALHRNIAPLGVYLMGDNKPKTPCCLKKHFHNDIYVATVEEENGQIIYMNHYTGLFYSSQKGIYRKKPDIAVKHNFNSSDGFQMIVNEW